MAKILLIDDDTALQLLLKEALAAEQHQVDVARCGEDGLDRTRHSAYDLVVLDVMMPGWNGFETLRRLRRISTVPIIMLTARGEEDNRINGLEGGADDYLAKPFQMRELNARIQAVLRRTQRLPPAISHTLTQGDISLDAARRSAFRAGQRLDLTTAEFELLQELLEHAGQPLSRDQLSQVVFGREYNFFDRGIDSLVSSLRRKLGPSAGGFERIKTLRGQGYTYVDLSSARTNA